MSRHHHHHPATSSHAPGTRSRLLIALVVTLGFVVIEAVAGIAAHSLALLTDAVHNLTDVAALALSWHALNLAGKKSGYATKKGRKIHPGKKL